MMTRTRPTVPRGARRRPAGGPLGPAIRAVEEHWPSAKGAVEEQWPAKRNDAEGTVTGSDAEVTRTSGRAILGLADGAEGVLPSQVLRRAVDLGFVDAGEYKVPAASIQPASIDLHLGDVAYRIRCSFLPDKRPVEVKLKDFVIDELDISRDGAVLETNRPYLIPLREGLALPPDVRGQGEPEELDRPARRVHPRDHRPRRPVRRDRARLPRSAVPRGRAALVHGPGEGRPRAEPAAAVGRQARLSDDGHPGAARPGTTSAPRRRAAARRRSWPRPTACS